MTTDVTKPSKPYEKAANSSWLLDADLWGGIDTLKDAGTRVFPMFPMESTAAWKERRDGARYIPFYPSAVTGIAGRLRESPLKPVATTIPMLIEWYNKQPYYSMMYGVDVDGVRHGASYILVDSDQGEPKLKPIRARDMLEVWGEDDKILYVRFRRQFTAPGDVVSFMYIVMYIENGTIVQRHYDNDGAFLGEVNKNGELVTVTEPSERLQAEQLPIVEFLYSDDRFTPYFKHLAYLSVSHYQSYGQQVYAENGARFNIMYGSELGDLVVANFGPRTLVKLGTGGSMGVLEGGGAGIAAGRADLNELRQEIESLSSAPYVADGFRSATEVNRSSDKEDSPLRRLADMRLEKGIEVMKFVAQWLGIDTSNSASYEFTANNSFNAVQDSNPAEVTAITSLVDKKLLDKTSAINAIVRSVKALKDTDPTEILQRLDEEAAIDAAIDSTMSL